ncbi:MAG: hypothetical protein JWQ43_992 [Glaciihabitans sp.]|nr:hypothetical protein [Glaciihabitans sp.]
MANLVETVTETVRSIGVKAAYGERVTIDGVEIMPVALVWFGFGAGGEGAGGDGDSGDGGGGGGGAAIPIGAYVSGDAGPTFRPNLIALLAVLIPLSWVGGKALSRVIRALKK